MSDEGQRKWLEQRIHDQLMEAASNAVDRGEEGITIAKAKEIIATLLADMPAILATSVEVCFGCAHCDMSRFVHVNEKCPFAPTNYKQAYDQVFTQFTWPKEAKVAELTKTREGLTLKVTNLEAEVNLDAIETRSGEDAERGDHEPPGSEDPPEG